MSPRRIAADIAELFVRGDKPTCLGLDARPKNIVRQSDPSLVSDCHCVMTAAVQQVCDLVGQFLIDLKPSRHYSPSASTSASSGIVVASAARREANLSAA